MSVEGALKETRKGRGMGGQARRRSLQSTVVEEEEGLRKSIELLLGCV